MKTIFTYPLDDATSFIDPDYVGNDTSGFQKRVNEFIDGDYAAWTGEDPVDNVDQIMRGMSAYYNAFEESWGENTFYQFHQQPMVQFVPRRLSLNDVSSVSIDNDSGIPKIKIGNYDHGFTSGDRIYGSGFLPESLGLNNDSNAMYADVINSSSFYITEDAGNTDYYISWLYDTIYYNQPRGDALGIRVMRHGDGAKIRVTESSPYDWDDDTVLQLLSSFTEGGDTGTANALATPFYISSVGGSQYSWDLYTDAAKTTLATLNEHYTATGTQTYTLPGTYNLEATTYADWGITGADITAIQAEVNGWVRITATVNSGTFTGKCDSPKTIGTVFSYSEHFYFVAGVTAFNIYDERGAGIIQDFQITGYPVDVDIEIKFINPARTVSGYSKMLVGDAGQSLNGGGFTTDATADWEVGAVNLLSPGVEQFKYQDSGNTTQNGAQFETGYWARGDTSATTTLAAGESLPGNESITLDGNGRLSTITFPLVNAIDLECGEVYTIRTQGTSDFTLVGAANNTTKTIFTATGPTIGDGVVERSRGRFNTSVLEAPFIRKLESKPSEYTPPAVTPAESEDIWDTEDEWTDPAYTSAQKEWPSVVAPESCEINYEQPSSITRSQSGKKYVRNAGFQKWSLDVKYPPMKVQDFQEYHTIVQSARGQTIPFYFMMYQDSKNILFRNMKTNNSTESMRLKNAVSIGDTTMLMEGLGTGDSFKKGDMISGQCFANDNGYFTTIMNDVTSNVFGEVKFRVPYPYKCIEPAGSKVSSPVWHVVVTLNENSFQYSVGAVGLYRLAVSFEFDSWK